MSREARSRPVRLAFAKACPDPSKPVKSSSSAILPLPLPVPNGQADSQPRQLVTPEKGEEAKSQPRQGTLNAGKFHIFLQVPDDHLYGFFLTLSGLLFLATVSKSVGCSTIVNVLWYGKGRYSTSECVSHMEEKLGRRLFNCQANLSPSAWAVGTSNHPV